MGQIQNAFLNAMGSLGQIAQLYRLSEPYLKQQKEQASQAAEQATNEYYQKKYGKVIKKRDHLDVRTEIIKNLKKEIPEEIDKAFQEKYKNYFEAKDSKQIKDLKTNLERQITNRQKFINDPQDQELQNLYSERFLLDKYFPSKSQQKRQSKNKNPNQAKGLEKTLDAAQEATDVRDNKRNMKNISGGMM